MQVERAVSWIFVIFYLFFFRRVALVILIVFSLIFGPNDFHSSVDRFEELRYCARANAHLGRITLVALHREGLASASLTIGKHRSIDSREHSFYRWSHSGVVDLLLCGISVEAVVEGVGCNAIGDFASLAKNYWAVL